MPPMMLSSNLIISSSSCVSSSFLQITTVMVLFLATLLVAAGSWSRISPSSACSSARWLPSIMVKLSLYCSTASVNCIPIRFGTSIFEEENKLPALIIKKATPTAISANTATATPAIAAGESLKERFFFLREEREG